MTADVPYIAAVVTASSGFTLFDEIFINATWHAGGQRFAGYIEAVKVIVDSRAS